MAGWSAVGTTDEERQADQKWWFIRLAAVMGLDSSMEGMIGFVERNENDRGSRSDASWRPVLRRSTSNVFEDYDGATKQVRWNQGLKHLNTVGKKWNDVHPLAMLAHELSHAYDDYLFFYGGKWTAQGETSAMAHENNVRRSLFYLNPGSENQYPRPGYEAWHGDCGTTAQEAWNNEPKWPAYP